MNRSTVGWVVAAGLLGAAFERTPTASAAGPARVVCNAFYQAFPSAFAGGERSVKLANELGGQVAPWLEEQMSQGASGVQLQTFVPSDMGGGVQLVCVSFPPG